MYQGKEYRDTKRRQVQRIEIEKCITIVSLPSKGGWLSAKWKMKRGRGGKKRWPSGSCSMELLLVFPWKSWPAFGGGGINSPGRKTPPSTHHPLTIGHCIAPAGGGTPPVDLQQVRCTSIKSGDGQTCSTKLSSLQFSIAPYWPAAPGSVQ